MNRRQAVIAIAGLALAPRGFAQAAPGDDLATMIARGARARVGVTKIYDPAYRAIGYPMGDVADDRGVCTDVVVRAFRHAGFDLQKLVHEDMRGHFAAYPADWGLKRPDRNIDHRRVPNLETYFRRLGAELPASADGADYQAGDVISWRLNGSGLPHMGVVVEPELALGGLSCRIVDVGEEVPEVKLPPAVAHNIGAGTVSERVLFDWPMTARFRFARAMFG